MARVRLIQSRDDMAPEHADLFDVASGRRGRVAGPSAIVLHSPGVWRPWSEVGEYLRLESVVGGRDVEVAILATARATDCLHVWNAHVPMADRAGVNDATIVAIRDREGTDRLPAEDGRIVRYVEQVLRDHRVADDVFDPLLAAHGAKWLVELTAWIGRYDALALLLNAFELVPANPAAPLPVDPDQPSAQRRGPVRPTRPTPRVPFVTAAELLPEADRAAFIALTGGRGATGGRGILLYSPQLSARVLDVGEWLRNSSAVVGELGSLAVATTARMKDCAQVWAVHSAHARAAIGDAAIKAVRDRGDLDRLPAMQRDVVDYVRQQYSTHRVRPELFDRLIAAHSIAWLVDLTCLMGHFGMVANLASAFELAPERDPDPLPLS